MHGDHGRTLESDDRDAHVEGFAGCGGPCIREGIQGDVHVGVGAQVVAVGGRQRQQVDAGGIDARGRELGQHVRLGTAHTGSRAQEPQSGRELGQRMRLGAAHARASCPALPPDQLMPSLPS